MKVRLILETLRRKVVLLFSKEGLSAGCGPEAQRKAHSLVRRKEEELYREGKNPLEDGHEVAFYDDIEPQNLTTINRVWSNTIEYHFI